MTRKTGLRSSMREFEPVLAYTRRAVLTSPSLAGAGCQTERMERLELGLLPAQIYELGFGKSLGRTGRIAARAEDRGFDVNRLAHRRYAREHVLGKALGRIKLARDQGDDGTPSKRVGVTRAQGEGAIACPGRRLTVAVLQVGPTKAKAMVGVVGLEARGAAIVALRRERVADGPQDQGPMIDGLDALAADLHGLGQIFESLEIVASDVARDASLRERPGVVRPKPQGGVEVAARVIRRTDREIGAPAIDQGIEVLGVGGNQMRVVLDRIEGRTFEKQRVRPSPQGFAPNSAAARRRLRGLAAKQDRDVRAAGRETGLVIDESLGPGRTAAESEEQDRRATDIEKPLSHRFATRLDTEGQSDICP